MSWPTQTINNWREFTELVDFLGTYNSALSSAYLFRGQADISWTLEPSIVRVLRGQSAADVMDKEKQAIDEFRKHAHLYLNTSVTGEPSDLLAWLTLMQHYGAPTRLLDWTTSAYVATYFAVDSSWSTDGAVWLFTLLNVKQAMDLKYGEITASNLNLPLMNQTYFEPTSPPHLSPLIRMVATERMIAQQGLFTICRQPLVNHAEAIEDALQSDISRYARKVIIPAKLKPEFLRRLRTMNIAANSLFPGIDGVGRSVAEILRIT
jgi:hypothetical protein